MCHIIIARSARNDYQFVTEEEVGMLVDSCPPHSHTPTLPRDSPSIVSPTHTQKESLDFVTITYHNYDLNVLLCTVWLINQ